MSQFQIVGKKFSVSAFADYAAHVPLDGWKPKRIVLHNTGAPSLAQRPNGLSRQHVADLQHYYQTLGWSGGPHLFIDQDGIWVFNPLDRRGTHSPSFNRDAWGIEMLGDYEREAFDAGSGVLVQRNTMSALAALFRRLGISKLTDSNFKLHKEDPRTTHDCPGKNVKKASVVAAVEALLTSTPTGVWPQVPVKIVIYRKGGGQFPSAVINGDLREGSVFAEREELASATGIAAGGTDDVKVRDFVGSKFTVTWDPVNQKVYLGEVA